MKIQAEFDYWDDNYWGPTQLHRGRPELEDHGSIFYVKVPVPGSVVTIVTTSGSYASTLTEMLKNCGVKVEGVEDHS